MHLYAPAHVSVGIKVCVCMHLHAFVWACLQVCVCVCVERWVGVEGCLNSKHDNPPFFLQLSLSSPKIGCTPFVTSHECLLNLLWRDLGVNLFPVEKAKLWNHKPKNKTCVTFGKPFMAVVCNEASLLRLLKRSRGQ